MSRCHSFPPPRFGWQGVSGQALVSLIKDIREAAEAEKQRKKQEKKKQRKRQRKLEKIAEKAKEAEQKKLDGNNEGRKNYNSKKIKPDTNCISDPSCSSEDMRVKAEAEKQGKKPDMKKEKEPKEKVETEERKKGEADQRNPKRMRIETKILGASSLRELHKELMVSDRQYSDNTKNWLRKNNPSSINLHKHGTTDVEASFSKSGRQMEELMFEGGQEPFLYPRAWYLKEADIYALPYTLPLF